MDLYILAPIEVHELIQRSPEPYLGQGVKKELKRMEGKEREWRKGDRGIEGSGGEGFPASYDMPFDHWCWPVVDNDRFLIFRFLTHCWIVLDNIINTKSTGVDYCISSLIDAVALVLILTRISVVSSGAYLPRVS